MKPYPTKKDTPSRKNRKSQRGAIFIHNATEAKKARSAARRLRNEAKNESQN
jgi:hypothetical protein